MVQFQNRQYSLDERRKDINMETLRKLAATASDNVGFLVISAAVVLLIILLTYGAEYLIEKKTGIPRKQDKLRVKRMALIAMLSAVSVVLMLFRFPLWFAPSFYKMDMSEIPVIIGAFALGPVAGILIEFIKILLNLLINGTDSAFVGEFANFLMGSVYIIPAASIYCYRKNRKRALVGLISGTLIASVTSAFLNAFLLLPKYVTLMNKDMAYFIQKGAEKSAAVSDLFTFAFFIVIPFNLIKYTLASLIVAIVYKFISKLIKEPGQ